MTQRGQWARLLGCALAAALLAGCAREAAPPRRPAAGAEAAVPPVVSRVATRDKVVFLAYEDGAGLDPRFRDLVRDRRLPVSLFLAGAGAGRLGELSALGAHVQNRTLTRALLPGLGYVEQHAEICGQRDRVEARFGAAPRLFHPPRGAYDANTLQAAAECGVDAIVLWREPEGRLRPGDILGARAGTTPDLLRRIEAEGYEVAALEDYL
ncbi:polysaccharide deacetylase family protein [Streptomyces endophyticus]|uniref:Polysaccharide deacetylase family protein n=1 Tax=Streptomyces endophyticus TaxID=714166 RepID=A0ABU6FD27_9ACTN|nr:polysaccharide deacetylase family protein [Streptomyces endophyticus]MEB8341537.1 polysaccharide deacetylase family protein [Streptomyces endophyticus]